MLAWTTPWVAVLVGRLLYLKFELAWSDPLTILKNSLSCPLGYRNHEL